MEAVLNKLKIKDRLKSDDHFGDSMLAFGMGISVFFFIFSFFLNYLANPGQEWKLLLIGSEIQFYEKLFACTLFLIFGSHVKANIIKRRQAEKKLEVSQEKYRNILESIEEGYYETSVDGDFSFLNPSMCKVLARPEKNILGTNFRSYLNTEDRKTFTTFFTELKNNEKHSQTMESEVKIKGGARKIIELSASLILNLNSQAVGIRGIVRDITEKKLLQENLLDSFEKIKEARAGVIMGLAKLAEYRDTDTGGHLERIREYSRVIAKKMSEAAAYSDYITPQYIEDIYQSSILHDIGKVGIPDSILLKKGKLTSEEFNKIKVHTLLGGLTLSEIIKQFKNQTFLTIGREIAYYHHEKWNGTGYPSGLAGEKIPLSARIVAIADVYDALTSRRCYKKAYSHEEAKTIISNESTVSFDPDIVDAFIASEKQFQQINATFSDEDPSPKFRSDPIVIHQEHNE